VDVGSISETSVNVYQTPRHDPEDNHPLKNNFVSSNIIETYKFLKVYDMSTTSLSMEILTKGNEIILEYRIPFSLTGAVYHKRRVWARPLRFTL
jgi:hypothetical protein